MLDAECRTGQRPGARPVRRSSAFQVGTCFAAFERVRTLGQKKTYIDVMENVFEGIRISTEESDVRSFRDLSARRSLGGFRVFSVEVNRASHVDESDRKKDA